MERCLIYPLSSCRHTLLATGDLDVCKGYIPLIRSSEVVAPNAVQGISKLLHSKRRAQQGASQALVCEHLPGVSEGGAPAGLAEVDWQLVLLVFDALIRRVLQHVSTYLHVTPHGRPVQSRVFPLHSRGIASQTHLPGKENF